MLETSNYNYLMARCSLIRSPSFMFVVLDFYDTFANEADMMKAKAVCVLLLVRSGAYRLG